MGVITSTTSSHAEHVHAKQLNRSFGVVVGALSTAIDLAEGHREGHALRTCVIGMKIGLRISLDAAALSDLYYALLLKDIAGPYTQSLDMAMTGQGGLQARRLLREGRSGMSLLEAGGALKDLYSDELFLKRTRKRAAFLLKRKTLRARTVTIRCAAGRDLLQRLGATEGTQAAICAVDEQWNGSGAPNGLRGTQIPLLGQIVKLAQMLEFFHAQDGGDRVVPRLHRRCRGWFDPGLVAAATRLFEDPSSWRDMDCDNLLVYASSFEPELRIAPFSSDFVDRICEVFADVADARSNYSRRHSAKVAEIAVQIARVLDLTEASIRTLRRASLLHDLGKLMMPRRILERQGSLSEEETALLHTYPLRTFEILNRVPGFAEIAGIAMSQHERLDGSGYPNHTTAEELSLPARILAVADVAEALSAERTFRKQFSSRQVYDMLMQLTPHQLDADCVKALRHNNVVSLVA